MPLEADLAHGRIKVIIDFDTLRGQLDAVQAMLAQRLPSVYKITLQADTMQFTSQVNQAASAMQNLVSQAATASAAMGRQPMHQWGITGAGGAAGSAWTGGSPWAGVGGWQQPFQPNRGITGAGGAFGSPWTGPSPWAGAGTWQQPFQWQLPGLAGGGMPNWAGGPGGAVRPPIPETRGIIMPGLFGTGQGPGMGRGFAAGALAQINPWLGAAAWTGNAPFALGMAGAEAGGWSIQQAMQRGWQEATIARIAGTRGTEREGMMDQIRGIGMRVPLPQENIYALGAGGARAGIPSDQLPAFIEGMSKLGVIIDDMDPNMLATDMARLLDLFDQSPDKIEKIGGALAALDQSSTASAGQILQLTQRFAGFASAMGMSLPQSMAIATLAGQVGIRPERGATALQRIMTQMTLDTEGQFSGMMGMSAEKWQARMTRDPFGAFTDVTKRIAAMPTGTEQTRAIYEQLGLHNVRDIELLQKFAAELDKLGPLLAKAAGSVAALNEQVSIMAETPEGQRRMTMNMLQQAGASTGDFAIDQARQGMEGALGAEVALGRLPATLPVAANAEFRQPFEMVDEQGRPLRGREAAAFRQRREEAIAGAGPFGASTMLQRAMRINANRSGGPAFLSAGDLERREARIRSEQFEQTLKFNDLARSLRNIEPDQSALGMMMGSGMFPAGFGPTPMGAINLSLAGPVLERAKQLQALGRRGATPFMEGSISGLDEYMRRSSTEILNSAKTIDDWQKRNAEERLSVQKQMLDELKKLTANPGLRVT